MSTFLSGLCAVNHTAANWRAADSYLLKTGDGKWEDGIVALEGGTCLLLLSRRALVAHSTSRLGDIGSGLGALSKLLETHPNLFSSRLSGDPGGEASSLTTAGDVYSCIQYVRAVYASPLTHELKLVCRTGAISSLTLI